MKKIKIISANAEGYEGKIGTFVRRLDKYAIVVYVPGFYESAIVTEYQEVKKCFI